MTDATYSVNNEQQLKQSILRGVYIALQCRGLAWDFGYKLTIFSTMSWHTSNAGSATLG